MILHSVGCDLSTKWVLTKSVLLNLVSVTALLFSNHFLQAVVIQDICILIIPKIASSSPDTKFGLFYWYLIWAIETWLHSANTEDNLECLLLLIIYYLTVSSSWCYIFVPLGRISVNCIRVCSSRHYLPAGRSLSIWRLYRSFDMWVLVRWVILFSIFVICVVLLLFLLICFFSYLACTLVPRCLVIRLCVKLSSIMKVLSLNFM